MAEYSDKKISLRSFVPTGWEHKYASFLVPYQTRIVLSGQASERKPEKTRLLACDFNLQSVVQWGFATRAEAEDRLSFLKSDATINEYKNITSSDGEVREIVYEVKRINFTGKEREVMPAMGALYGLRYESDADIIKQGFPALVHTKITDPQPVYDTHNGDLPNMVDSAYIYAPKDVMEIFNRMASGEQDYAVRAIHKMLDPHGVADEKVPLFKFARQIGRAELGLKNTVKGARDVLQMQVYDYKDTVDTGASPFDIKQALEDIGRQKPNATAVLMDVLKARGLYPAPDKGPNPLA